MAFYPSVINLANNMIQIVTDSNATGGLGYYDLNSGATKYAFQATITPFTNTENDIFQFDLEDNLKIKSYSEFEESGSYLTQNTFTASFDRRGDNLLEQGLFIDNTFVTESLSGSFAIYETQITASKGFNIYHRYMSGSLTQSLHLTASEGLYATGSSYFKGTFDITDAVTLGDTLSVSGDVTGSSNLRVVGDSKLVGGVVADSTVSIGDTLTVISDITGSSNLRVAGTTKLVGDVEADGNVTVGGNLTVQGTTTTISSSNTTFQDPIIGLGITGSETFNDVGDRGIVFGRGAAQSDALPGIWWDGTQFNLAKSATSPLSSSFGSITSYSPIRVGSLTLDGTLVTSTAAELNILDGATLDVNELNILDGATVTTAELNILDGATLDVNELNTLDGITASTAELNILDGATLDVNELNILDGATVTTAELNILDGATVTFGELNLLDGSSAGTVVNSKAVIYGSSGEINGTTITATSGLSGSLTQLSDGSSYLVEGSNITITTGSNGQITIASSGGSGLANIVEDTTPQLGGHLDINGKTISGSLIPATAETYDLGSATGEWGDLYLQDSSNIYFGADQDVYLAHTPDVGIVLNTSSTSSGFPQFTVQSSNSSGTGPTIKIKKDSSSPYIPGIDGLLDFISHNSSGTDRTMATIRSQPISITAGSERGRLTLGVYAGGSIDTDSLQIEGTTNSAVTTVDITSHNGTTGGLKLGGTLVTAIASELNILDGGTAATSTTVVDADRVVFNDDGTMKQVAMSDIKDYIGGSILYSGKTSNFTASTGYHYGVNTTSGNVVVTLPAVSSNTSGVIRFKIKSGTNSLTLNPNGSDTIDDLSSVTLTDLYQSISLISDGSSNWEIF